MAVRLIEREEARGALLDAASQARTGAGRVVLVAGEAGVGKSALVDALQPELPDAEWLVGACDGQFTPRPLGPLLDVAAQVGGALAATCRAGTSRAEQFAALLDLLHRPHLTVLLVEDVHWADDATLDLLRFVARRVRHLRCLVILTFRDDAVSGDDAWRQAIGELARQHATQRLDVRPLSLDGVRDLAGPSGLDPGTLHRLTGGNAFFLTELLAAGSTDLPRSARDAVLARALRVSPAARSALDVMAVLGGRMEPSLLARAGLDGPDVDELVDAGLLVTDGDAVRFRHELARVAVDAELTPHRRIDVHRRVFDALQSSGCDDDARLAFHADGAGRAEAVRELAPRAAARAAALGAHREAVLQYRRALRHADLTDARCLAELDDALSMELTFLDRWEEAAEARRAGLARWRTLDEPRRVGDGLRRLSSVMWRLCRGAESVRCAQQAVALLEPLGPTPELGWAYASRSADAADLTTMAADVDGARRLALELDQPDLLGTTLVIQGEIAARRGDEWEPLLREALSMAIDRGLDVLAGGAYSTLYELLVTAFRLTDAEADYDAGVAFCDDRELAVYGSCLRGRHALALVEQGRWDDALDVADEVLTSTASPVNLLTSRVATALVRMRRGDPPAAVDAVLVPALDAAATLGETPWIVMTRLARAEQRWLAADDEAARTEVATAARRGRADVPCRARRGRSVGAPARRVDRCRRGSGRVVGGPCLSVPRGPRPDRRRQ